MGTDSGAAHPNLRAQRQPRQALYSTSELIVIPHEMLSCRTFLPASRPALALSASSPRDFYRLQPVQQVRSCAYHQKPRSTELKQFSFPRTQLISRHSCPTSPTKSVRASIDKSLARTLLDRRSYSDTRNKEVIDKMANQGMKYLHFVNTPASASTNLF